MLKSSMEQSTESRLTIYFDEPFWVGVFEELDGKRLSVCRVVFGSEPTDAEIYAFILRQQALQKQYEENKLERKQHNRRQKEAEKQRLFELRQQKRKEKHRGHLKSIVLYAVLTENPEIRRTDYECNL